MKAFLTIHSDLPREGPGDAESLAWALAQVDLPEAPRILDAGCGPGADIAGLLAHRPAARLLALDTHAPYVARVQTAYRRDPRVTARVADMASPEGVFDLIWCAGALYFLGVRSGLAGWRSHLRPGGAVLFSQLCWTGRPRSPEVEAFWTVYPDMQDADGVLQDTRAAGFAVTAHRFLPPQAWAAYYDPLEARLDALAGRAEDDAELREAIAGERAEIALWRAHGAAYGYLQVAAVLQ